MNGRLELIDLYTYQANNLRMKINNLFLVAQFSFQ